tara:strand:+ start:90 stop:326 length:237 start_codon:yes stop_codon:yes gene_type:complete
MEYDKDENAERFIAVCNMLGLKPRRQREKLVDCWEVQITVRKQHLIRTLKRQLNKDGIDYGVVSIGRNTRYYGFRVRA